jgi:hypothetical protein
MLGVQSGKCGFTTIRKKNIQVKGIMFRMTQRKEGFYVNAKFIASAP